MWKFRRRGITLLELLVVAAILATLLALILPAVQKVREAANKMQCASNLRQLGIAAHHFHNDHGRLPPGYLGPSLRNNVNYPILTIEGQWVGHSPLILPYLEQDHLAKRLDIILNPHVVTFSKWWWVNSSTGPGIPKVANFQVAMTDLKIFRCPSAPRFTVPVGNTADEGGGTLLGFHVFNSPEMGVSGFFWKDEYGPSNSFRPLPPTNYMGVAGCGSGTDPYYSQYEGVYTNRSNHSLGELATRDGTSNTLLYGETCGSHLAGSPPESYYFSWMAMGSLTTYLGLQRGGGASVYALSSWHSPGVQFCFADGSVRTVRFGTTALGEATSNNTDWLILQQLAGYRDGQSADVSSLME